MGFVLAIRYRMFAEILMPLVTSPLPSPPLQAAGAYFDNT
jgi:hypothetical protein